MECSLPYIDNSQHSETEKARLNSLHLQILEEAKASNAFRREDNRFVTIKNAYNKATEFIASVNEKYGPKIATLPAIGNNKHALNINVLPLSVEKQGELFFNIETPQVQYTLKSINILQSPKADEIFRKGDKNNWTIEKIMQELAIPKEQQELIKSFNTRNREQILTSLLANYSYTIEINTAKERIRGTYNSEDNQFEPEFDEEGNILQNGREGTANAQYYSNLTVPGGTNYTENEIATPAITPSIKGHAQFSTDQGIGWFRSDEQRTDDNKGEKVPDGAGGLVQLGVTTDSKTRRILEVQSDLFQKGRDKKNLLSPFNVTYQEQKGKTVEQVEQEQSKKSENQFLQLLNKDNNWVTFFIKSIIQDSAKKGYEKVLFPTGNTASKVEGHTTLEQFKKQKEDRLNYVTKEINNTSKDRFLVVEMYDWSPTGTDKLFDSKKEAEDYAKAEYGQYQITDLRPNADKYITDLTIEKQQLKQELERIEKEGFGALKPIWNFYENTVTNILKKNYNITKVTDEYGNTWNEIEITPEVRNQAIFLQKQGNTQSVASDVTVRKIKKILDKMGVTLQELQTYLNQVGAETRGVNAIADLAHNVIAIAEGKEAETITEEMVHIATYFIEQKDPALVTEMISKISRFKIYKDTYEAYKNTYTLSNGKPDIRKIKKEAVDRLIAEVIINKSENVEQFPELLKEENRSLVYQMWQAILDWIKGQYRKANIDIFQTVAEDILAGKVTNEEIEAIEGPVFFNIERNKAVDQVYDKILDIDSRMKLVPQMGDKKRHYTFDEVEVARSVTEKIKENQNLPDRTEEERKQDDQKREWGSEGHNYIANYIETNLIDKDGYKLDTPKTEEVNSELDTKVRQKLERFAKELINSYKPGTRFLVEKKVINEKVKGKLASTMDFVAIEPDGNSFKMDVYDWKFASINTQYQEDVPWYKKKEWNEQMKEYTQMMYNYGVKPENLRKARMIPFQANYIVNKKKNLYLTSLEIGNLDPTKEPNMYLLPVPLDTESSGEENIDKLTRSLREYHRKLYNVISSPEEQHLKNQKLNELSKAIRSLHLKKDFAPIIDVGFTFINNAVKVFKSFENIDYSKLSEKEINDILGELLDIQESAIKFASLDEAFLKVFPREGLSEEDKKVLEKLQTISSRTRAMQDRFQELFDDYTVFKATKEGLDETVLNPEIEISSFAKTFLEGSKLPSKIIRLASNLILRAKSLVDLTVNRLTGQLSPLLTELEKEAKSKGKSAFDLIGRSTEKGLYLISKIDPEFKKEVYKNRESKNKKFFIENMDMEKYQKLMKETIDRRIEEENKKHYSDDKRKDKEKRDLAIEKIKDSLNIKSNSFKGFDDFDFKRLFWESLKEDDHLSKEYKEMSEAARKVWQFFTDLNVKARQLGYISGRNGLSFFPLMEATILEKLSKTNNILSESGDILKDLYTVRAEEERAYSKIDEETGELKKEIPKLFTRSRKSAKQLSTDLNKVGALWIKALSEYESSKNIEHTLLVLHNVEKNKGRIVTDSSGKPIFEAGVPKTVEENEKNASVLEKIIDDAIYGLKENLSSIGNVSISKAIEATKPDSAEETKEDIKLSTKKGLESANKLVQSLAVGLKLLVAIPNYVGVNMQAAINSGRLITFAEFQKNNVKVTTNTLSQVEKGLLDKILPLNEDASQEARRRQAKKEGFLEYLNTWSFHDVMMVTNSFPDRLLQFANALSFLENTMVVDGKLVNIRQYVLQEDRKAKVNMSYEDRRELEKSYENRVKKLKEEKSIVKTAKVSDEGVEIPGISEEELAKYRVKIIEYGRNLTGQINQNNKADYRRDTILKSFMMFKNWIPKQISLRTLDINKNLELDQWEYGRTRAFVKTLMHLGFRNIADIRDIMLGTDKGLSILNDIYNRKKEAYYQKTGQQLEISEEEFYDLMREEIRNQMKELALLVSLVGLLVAVKLSEPPDDEDDKYRINQYKFWAKASNKIADELFFYYNPLSFESITRGTVLPALGILVKTEKFLEALGKETYARAVDDEELMDKTHPTKYFLNLMPIGSQFQNEILPIIDPQMAQELGIKSTTEARAMR